MQRPAASEIAPFRPRPFDRLKESVKNSAQRVDKDYARCRADQLRRFQYWITAGADEAISAARRSRSPRKPVANTTTGRWTKGTSGNPAGRPVGSRKSTLLLQSIVEAEIQALVRKTIERGLEGAPPLFGSAWIASPLAVRRLHRVSSPQNHQP